MIIIICLGSGLPEPLYVTQFINITQEVMIENKTVYYHKNKCVWDDPTEIYSYWFIAYEVMIPFLFMLIFSSISIKTIFDSRSRLKANNKSQSNQQSSKKTTIKAKDVKFAFTSIALNVTFLLFVFPTNFLDILVYFISFDFDLAYVISETFYHLNFAVVFFINLWFNSIFKNEFMKMVGIKSSNFNSVNGKSKSTSLDEF